MEIYNKLQRNGNSISSGNNNRKVKYVTNIPNLLHNNHAANMTDKERKRDSHLSFPRNEKFSAIRGQSRAINPQRNRDNCGERLRERTGPVHRFRMIHSDIRWDAALVSNGNDMRKRDAGVFHRRKNRYPRNAHSATDSNVMRRVCAPNRGRHRLRGVAVILRNLMWINWRRKAQLAPARYRIHVNGVCERG